MHRRPLILIWILGPAILLCGQESSSNQGSKVNLASPSLQGNADLTIFHMGPQLDVWMSGARATAASKEISWTGLDVIAFPGLPAALPNTSSVGIAAIFQQRVCQVDLVAVGHIQASASHLSASRNVVYTDYDFVIDRLLKDNRTAPIGSAPDLVVTRLGGSVVLAEGNLKLISLEFPELQPNAIYLLFLDSIGATSSYFARDEFSTLMLIGDNWAILQKSYASVTIPGFTRGTFESSLADWLGYCGK